MENVGIPRN